MIRYLAIICFSVGAASAAPLAAQAVIEPIVLPSPAENTLPGPVRAMIDASIATGDETKVRTVVELATATYPAAKAEIDALHGAFRADRDKQRQLAEQRRIEAIRQASLVENWKGRGEIGGFRSTGNSQNSGLSAALDLKREGIDWTHQLRGRIDYQRSAGVTSREKYFGAYEPRYQVGDDLFVYGLAQFESDRFQGYDQRYALSAGAGYQVLKRSDLNLSVKAGPALRRTDFTNGETDTRLAGLLGVDFDWTIADGVKLTQDTNLVAETGGAATVIFDSRNTTLALVTGLEARITGKLSTRLSYAVDYQSDPQPGKVSTDTLSRVTFVYGF